MAVWKYELRLIFVSRIIHHFLLILTFMSSSSSLLYLIIYSDTRAFPPSSFPLAQRATVWVPRRTNSVFAPRPRQTSSWTMFVFPETPYSERKAKDSRLPWAHWTAVELVSPGKPWVSPLHLSIAPSSILWRERPLTSPLPTFKWFNSKSARWSWREIKHVYWHGGPLSLKMREKNLREKQPWRNWRPPKPRQCAPIKPFKYWGTYIEIYIVVFYPGMLSIQSFYSVFYRRTPFTHSLFSSAGHFVFFLFIYFVFRKWSLFFQWDGICHRDACWTTLPRCKNHRNLRRNKWGPAPRHRFGCD